MTTEYDPYEHAASLSITVELNEHELRPQDDGAWFMGRSYIALRPGMSAVRERCVLSHELGHAVNGHVDDRPKHEVIADRWAAESLVDRKQLIEAMGWTADPARWAYELEVTTKIMRMYLNVHRLDLARERPQPYRTRLVV